METESCGNLVRVMREASKHLAWIPNLVAPTLMRLRSYRQSATRVLRDFERYLNNEWNIEERNCRGDREIDKITTKGVMSLRIWTTSVVLPWTVLTPIPPSAHPPAANSTTPSNLEPPTKWLWKPWLVINRLENSPTPKPTQLVLHHSANVLQPDLFSLLLEPSIQPYFIRNLYLHPARTIIPSQHFRIDIRLLKQDVHIHSDYPMHSVLPSNL